MYYDGEGSAYTSIAMEPGEIRMTVKAVLCAKGSEVITTGPAATVQDAIGVLRKHGIGALIVLGPERRVMGVLSERDVVLALAERGAVVLEEPVSQVMTRRVFPCIQSETITSIMQRMTTGKFRHLPVLEHDRLIGIISIGDVVKHRLMEMERESEALHDYIQTA